ncbi:MAG: replication initiation protein [Paludibacteraceae bacterium]|nr:replication initiation protein [Paludibacteraceae bacterium]
MENNVDKIAEGDDLKRILEVGNQVLRNFADSTDPLCKKVKVGFIIDNCVPYSFRGDGGINFYTKRSVYEMFEDPSSEYHFFAPLYQIMDTYRIHFTLYDVLPAELDEFQKGILLKIRRPMERFYSNLMRSKAGEELFIKMQDKQFDSVTDVTFFQSNRLTQARQKFSLIQKKFMSYMIANFQKSNPQIFGGACMDVPTAELVSVGCASSNLSLRRSLSELQKKLCVDFEDEDGNWQSIALITKLEMAKWGKSIYVEMSPTMVSLVNRITAIGNYTTMNLSTTMRTRSYTTLRLYELCSQFKNSEKMMVNITDKHLRELLNCEEKFSDSCDFERYVIKPAQEELERMANEGESELYFDYTIGNKVSVPGQKRRAITNWIFFIKVVGNSFRQNLLKMNKKDKEKLCVDFYMEVITSFFPDTYIQEDYIRKFKMLDYDTQLNYVEELNFKLPNKKEKDAKEYLNSSLRSLLKTKSAKPLSFDFQ